RSAGGPELPAPVGLLRVPREAAASPGGRGCARQGAPARPAEPCGERSHGTGRFVTGGVRGAAELGVDLAAPRSRVLLAIADDALIGGHRASHWTGVAPTIEEDLAFSTLAQDGITQADLWYRTLLGENATDEAV